MAMLPVPAESVLQQKKPGIGSVGVATFKVDGRSGSD
jgi:hypothetical protein